MKAITTIALMFILSQFCIAQKIDVYQRPVQHERSRDFDAIHYKVTLNIDIDKKILTGENLITIQPLNDNFSRCVLDARSLVVRSVINCNGTVLPYEQKDNQLIINLTKSYSHSDTIRFTVKYSLDKPVPGLLFIDSTATNPKMVCSDCWPDKARQWIPCYDYPNDKVTNEMVVTVDKKYRVLSNGRLVSVTENRSEGTRTFHWNQDLPHSTYLINLSIADYAVIHDSLGSLPVNYWVYKGLEANAKTTFRKTPYMISFYNKIFNYNYPWAKYDQVISSYLGGGAEATSATILGEEIVMDTIAEKDYSREWVIAHEIAHQWWGDLITLRSWEHNWLNESFGTYSDYLYTRYDKGEDIGAYDLLGKKNQYLNEAHNRYMRPIVFNRYNGPGDNFDSHAYPKGACILHLLRYILGDDTFFRTLSTFLHENEFKPVDTYDFMKTVREVSGKNMDWFFEQYIFSPGHPVFEVHKTWDITKKILKMTIIQKQDSVQGVPIYTIPVNFGFFFSDKKIVKEVWLKNKVETLEFELDSEPLLVRFDDGNFLLKEISFIKSIEELLYQAEHDDMIGRLSAIDELKSFSDDKSVLLLWSKLATHDSYWAVRQAALENTGKYQGVKAVDMIKACLSDKNSKVRQSSIRILGDLKDPKLVNLFIKIFRNENSYAVKAECLISVGKCGGKQQLAFLKKAEATKSYQDIVNKASKRATGMIMKKQG
jgi:aminopeptidase N